MGRGRRWRWVLLRCVVGGGCAGAASGVVWAGALFAWSLVALRSGPEAARPGPDLLLVSAIWAGSVGAVLGAVAGGVLGLGTAGVGERWNRRWLSLGTLLAVLPPLVLVALALVGITRVIPSDDGAAGPFLLAWGFALVGVLVVHRRTWWLNYS